MVALVRREKKISPDENPKTDCSQALIYWHCMDFLFENNLVIKYHILFSIYEMIYL